jgi:hypothetical protein
LYFPIPQSSHFAEELENFPGEQSSHVVPEVVLTFPEAQAEQSVFAALEDLPASQAKQSGECDLSVAYLPAEHLVQLVDPTADL